MSGWKITGWHFVAELREMALQLCFRKKEAMWVESYGRSQKLVKETIQVKDQAGALREVFVYTMNSPHKDVPARPSKFYLDGILEGCLENGLPTKAVMDAVKRTRQEMKKAEKQYTR